MNLIVTRPEEDASPLKARLEALGHAVMLAPLLRIVPRSGIAIPQRPYQAVAITSANGVRALTGNERIKSIRVLTVGPQSLRASHEAGFRHAEAHGGDVNGLARFAGEALKPADGPILYLSGAQTAGDLQGLLEKGGFDVDRVVLYDAVPAADLGEASDALRRGWADAVLLYSPRSARIWCDLVTGLGLIEAAARPHYLCLSRNVAAALPAGWHNSIAATPDEGAMLALLETCLRNR